MKTATKIGFGLIGLGVALAAVAFIITGGDLKKLGLEQYDYIDKDYTCTGDIDTIVVDENTGKIIVQTGDVDKVTVAYMDDKNKELYNIKEDGGTFSIKRKKEGFHFGFGIEFKSPTMTITVPKDFDGTLQLECTTGKVSARDMTVKSITAESTTGDVILTNIVSKEEVNAEATTGDVKLIDVSSEDSIKMECTTGDVVIENLDAKNAISLNTTTGDIKGTIVGKITDFAIKSDTTTGDNNLPNTSEGEKSLKADTTTGDIKVTFVEN